LRGHKHENLVSIYGGGVDIDKNLYYVVMELLAGPNLKKSLTDIRVEDIPSLIGQLASAARFLEELGLVHRDIKPENIALLESSRRLVLMDLGVIRPTKGSDLTDPAGVQAFVGTLQYSSPEFLLREEDQSPEGYRALTFYQIGAVLHDLIMKRPIFEKFVNPYAKLVNAVQHERPIIANPDVPPELIDLAKRCLLKSPLSRSRVVHWEDFHIESKKPRASARDRVAERMVTLRAQSEDTKLTTDVRSLDGNKIRKNLLGTLSLAAITARASLEGLPPLRNKKCEKDDACWEFELEASPDKGFPHGLVIRVCVEIIDPVEAVVSCKGCAHFPALTAELTYPKEKCLPWFEGVLETVALHEAFEQFFFQATEWCMQVSPGVDARSSEVFFSTDKVSS
jgi:serine/threonine protein kinase